MEGSALMLDHPWSNSFTKISRKPKWAPSPLNNGPTWYVGWCCGFWMLIWKKGRMFCKWPYLVLLSVDMLELFWGLNFLFFFTYIVLTLLIVVVAFLGPYFNNLLYFFLYEMQNIWVLFEWLLIICGEICSYYYLLKG